MPFKYCGFADEAGKKLDEQIAVTQALEWPGIEIRMADGKHTCDYDDAEFERLWERLQAAGIGIASFGAQIANWSRPITGDFSVDVAELKRNIPRMQKVGCKIIRCMSYPNDKDRPLGNDEWRAEVVRRLRELARMAADGGVILGHENCNGYGGLGPSQFLELVEEINNPAFKLIIDTGNQTMHCQDVERTWSYYEETREHVCHVHIKCARKGPEGTYATCYPDEDPVQPRILKDLKARGYDGWLSIEPHLEAAIHAGKDVQDVKKASWVYVEFGRRLMRIVDEL
jgi:sugar phosphate isomerase/epimerase